MVFLEEAEAGGVKPRPGGSFGSRVPRRRVGVLRLGEVELRLADDFSRAWRRLTRRGPPDPAESGFIARATQAGAPLTVFLESSRSLWHRVFLRRPSDPLPALFDAQGSLDRPIQLVPVLVVWQRGLDRQTHPALRAVLPDPDRVWWVWRLFKLAWYPSDNFVQVGEAVDLQSFLQRVPEGNAQND